MNEKFTRPNLNNFKSSSDSFQEIQVCLLREKILQRRSGKVAKVTKNIHNTLRIITKDIFAVVNGGGGPRGVMAKAVNCGIVVSEFVLQSRYYVHLLWVK